MKKIYCVLLCFIFLSLNACKNDKQSVKDPILTEIGGSEYEKYIRTPVNPDGTLDSTKMPRIFFDTPIHDFGTLTQSDKRSHVFTFKNPSKIPLYILDVNTSCGCTVASYDEKGIEPGETGEIAINYDPKGRKGIQEKKVIVTSNAYPNKTELTIIADVLSDDLNANN